MASQQQDLLIVMDATGSMGTYLHALRQSVPEIIALSKLSGAFNRIAILAYRDYNEQEANRIIWSGWDCADLSQFTADIWPRTLGINVDEPEAAKTALNHALQHCAKNSHTLILWYADAPPHTISSKTHNAMKERNAFPGDAFDWVKLSYKAKDQNCNVLSFIPRVIATKDSLFYVFLSQLTGGTCIISPASNSAEISRLTLDVILKWMGVHDTAGSPQSYTGTCVRRYRLSPLEAQPKVEKESDGWLPLGHQTLLEVQQTYDVFASNGPELSSIIPVGPLITSSRSHSLAKRFADPAEVDYRTVVYKTLSALIDTNIYALTYNPIFGQLWRAVCKEHTNDAKQALVDAFSLRVSQMSDPKQKADMQQWLEDSFDATEEIEEIIAGAEADSPRVYLDLDSEVELTRKELLEVSKSCYAAVLKKVATVFTHLKIVEKDITLGSKQRSIPLSLRPRDFFRLLPHLVVPGTLYPLRAASLTAILALVTGVSFLQETATALLAPLKGKWITLDVPENVSFDCARFLLSAPRGTVLTTEEQKIYEAMKRYKLIELNLDSSLAVQMPWTPEKTRDVGDNKILCKTCHVLRSVTIMSHEQPGVCGLCITIPEQDIKELYGETDEMQSCWVECSVRSCRAQYVVEDVAKLRVRPKCYYCRAQTQCPWLACTLCTNRVIVPIAYRNPNDLAYTCPGCRNPSCKHQTIVPSETNARELIAENGVEWLDVRANNDILQGKSAFKLIQAHGIGVFDTLSYDEDKKLTLTHRGKTVHNARDVREQVERRVGSGEVELGCCPLCFDDKTRDRLSPACGRSKCVHRVDQECLVQWYGRNKPGKLLNLMQFSCPFCRRTPTIKILTRYNPRAAALAGLADAVGDHRWYYAWCVNCGFAKRAFEKACCEERLPAVDRFQCEDCQPSTVSASSRIVPCPKCGVMIEKTEGCNHIECQCGQHFCYVCGEGHSSDDIYHHMTEVHGGIYDDSDEDEDNDVEY